MTSVGFHYGDIHRVLLSSPVASFFGQAGQIPVLEQARRVGI
jgi:hypothetical protein